MWARFRRLVWPTEAEKAEVARILLCKPPDKRPLAPVIPLRPIKRRVTDAGSR